RCDLTITDAASGEFGQVSVFGRGVYFGDDQLLAPRVRLELDGDCRRELILGGNRYSIAHSIEQWEGDLFSSLYADVTVSPVSATPEPGTLGLASLGLAGVWVGRRVRRQK
ncbi:MAG: PEP-CTERM sorting domain-containing protein, partial [Gemmataceae bacterium]|nr:PEP-CTERM sorting domain-containing protein [Gemmataceae bacterium]